MYGAIIGDIVGSRFELRNIDTKDFTFFHPTCRCTDDSIMTLAVYNALIVCDGVYDDLSEHTVRSMQTFGRQNPHAGYGRGFRRWLFSTDPQPYNSYGNGAAMRVSPCGWFGRTLEEVKDLSYKVTCVTHNHPEGIKGAEATAVAVFLARTGHSMDAIDEAMQSYYRIDRSLDALSPSPVFDVTCQGTVPRALAAFFASTSFEDAIRNAVSISGDTDTLAAITGSIAEAYWGIPDDMIATANRYLGLEQSLPYPAARR